MLVHGGLAWRSTLHAVYRVCVSIVFRYIYTFGFLRHFAHLDHLSAMKSQYPCYEITIGTATYAALGGVAGCYTCADWGTRETA
jgi:hypothetical protein